MKKLPRDVSSFPTMIQENYIYVDKTHTIYNLYATGDRFFFLSRPRRFGKSLLISLLKELFSGNKELFRDCWIGKSDFTFTKHPIIHLDFSAIAHRSPDDLESSLRDWLDDIAREYGVELPQKKTLEDHFRALIKELATINKVVLLVDEYDHPLLKHIHSLEIAEKNREILRSFYEVAKGLSGYFKSIFITGVTKFSKTSIFSGINNLIDITLHPESSELLGYTKNEIEHYFTATISDFAEKKGQSSSTILLEMKNWYNGYAFSRETEKKVYNPFSVLYYLKNQSRENYWFESGTPSFLITLLKTQYTDLQDIDTIELSKDSLGTFDIGNIPLITLLFQTGYLTIVGYNTNAETYKLDYPNLEVEESFKKYIVAALTRANPVVVDRSIKRITAALQQNDLEAFCRHLQILFAHIPYNLHVSQERYYHSLFQFMGTLIGIDMQSEVATDKGRIDLVAKTSKRIYLFEFKFNTDPAVALAQIERQKYYERYLHENKEIVLVGLSFNRPEKQLVIEWKQNKIAF